MGFKCNKCKRIIDDYLVAYYHKEKVCSNCFNRLKINKKYSKVILNRKINLIKLNKLF